MSMQRNLLHILSILVILTLLFSSISLPPASAQGTDGIQRQINTQTGKLSFLGPEDGRTLSAARALGTSVRPQDPAMALVKRFGPEFGVKDPERDMSVMTSDQSDDGRITVRYQQNYEGIPVMGGELIVNTNERGDLYSITGEVSSTLSLPTQAAIDPEQARQTALESMAKWHQKTAQEFVATEPELWIYDESLLRPSTRPAELVWRMNVTSADSSLPVRELVLVNAQRGGISLHFNQIDTAWSTNEGAIQDPDPTATPPPTETPRPTETSLPTETPEPVITQEQVVTATPALEEPIPTEEVAVLDEPRAEAAAATVATWYVATTGNDSNSCATPAAPCKTIQAAVDKANSGDTVKLVNGTYTSTEYWFLVIRKNITISGGWNSGFTIQKGMSILDGQNARNMIGANYDVAYTLDHLMIVNSLYNGIVMASGNTLTLSNSTVALSSQFGILAQGTLHINNSIVSRNNGGIGFSSGTNAYINNSTITENSFSGISLSYSNSLHIKNSILAKNTESNGPVDCSSQTTDLIMSEGHNIFGNVGNCNFTFAAGDQTNTDPLLTDFLSVGYYALLPNSPAINAGNPASCLTSDQRGIARGSACDIGSYEYAAPSAASTVLVQAGNKQRVLFGREMSAPLRALVLDAAGSPVGNVTVTFTAPASGATGIFSDSGTRTTSARTTPDGIAISSSFTANSIAGTYNVSAAVPGIASSAFFSLTNMGWYVSTTGSNSNSCSSPSSPCATIAGAISKAYPGDTIFVAQGTYKGTNTEVVYLPVEKHLNLSGGWNATFTSRTGRSTIDGENTRKGINNVSEGNTTIEHFIIQNTIGGIWTSSGTLTLVDNVVQNNIATYGAGIVIGQHGKITILNSLITNNTNNSNTAGAGIALYNFSTVTIANSTISNNTSINGSGGGIYAAAQSSLNIENSTITGNMAGLDGGGLAVAYGGVTLNINNSTIANNKAQNGGGLFIEQMAGVHYGTFNVRNSIIANNLANSNGADCYNVGNMFDLLNYSLIGDSTGCSAISETGNLKNIDPGMASVLMGWTGFHPLKPTSPAIDSGDPDFPGTCLSGDQRGISRSSPCDMGAVEYMPAGAPAVMKVLSGSPQLTYPNATFEDPFRVLITDVQGNPVNGINVVFTAPGSGPSGIFSDTHSNTMTAVTQDGIATSSSFSANNLAGRYYVTATVAGISGSYTFQLTNFDAWYVAVSGNDSNNCMAVSTPCRTISGVLAKPLFTDGDPIKLAGGMYQLGTSVTAPQVITINRSAAISGGWNATFTTQDQMSIIDGQGVRRGLRIFAGADVSLDHVIVRNGRVSDNGAGIWNEGNLTLSDCLVEKNQAGVKPPYSTMTYTSGGGIHNTGALTVTNCSVQYNYADGGGGINSESSAPVIISNTKIMNNDARYSGGGLSYYSTLGYIYDDASSITNSIISGNTTSYENGDGGGISMGWGRMTIDKSAIIYNAVQSAFSNGGGISNHRGIIYLNNSTVSSNISHGSGGGIYNESDGKIYLNNATVSFNVIPLNKYSFGAGIYHYSHYDYETTVLQNSLIALNAGGRDCYGRMSSNGYNLIGNVDGCTYTRSTGDLLGTSENPINPLISIPRDNGGGTFTNALFSGSPALNAGNPAVPESNPIACLSTDQRGVTRTNVCDIGATEGSIAPVVEANVAVFTHKDEATVATLGTFLCGPAQIPCTNGIAPEADKAQTFAIGIHDFYYTIHQRKSVDGLGFPLILTVEIEYWAFNCPTAAWNGTQMWFCKGMVADDVVAHEFTHGVTQNESNLFPYYQSGAISESLSDLWGEYYDQGNGLGNDIAGVRWQIGEDTVAGTMRSMSNPPAYGDPDKMSSPNYYEGEDDNGGIHANSGVNNKAVYLLVQGGTFNGKTITAIGWEKTAAIYYEVNTNLLFSGSDYSDLYYALQLACTNLLGKKGITSSDCAEVKDAINAVEMNGQPAPNFNRDTALCSGSTPVIFFADDLEAGTGNWTFTNGGITRWQWDSPYGQYVQSGSHALYADDYPPTIADASARLTSLIVPNNAYLHFAHAYDFETGYLVNNPTLYNFDGGVLEYRLNGGSTWIDAGSLIEINNYKGTLYNGSRNPLGGRSAFIGSSHGYISTRLNLASLAGKAVNFRWRMGLDWRAEAENDGYAWGWWVDNVKLYTCGNPTVFADVANTHWAWQYVERLYNAKITGGCGTNPLQYCPESTVTRAQMAIFLVKGIHGSSYAPPAVGGSTGFGDVSTTHWAAKWIKQLAVEKVTGGCASGKYCPEAPVTRAQMAIFLLKAKHGSSYKPPAVGDSTGFSDVPTEHWAAAWIKQLAAEGITGGCGTRTYCPDTPVTRAQMAVFLVKTFNLP